jgi:hypothetical protein
VKTGAKVASAEGADGFGVLMPWSRNLLAPPPGPMFRLGVAVSIVAATASPILPAGSCRPESGDGMLPLLAAPSNQLSPACVDAAIAPAEEARLADPSIEILRIANAIGNAAAQRSAITQNARGPSTP